MNYSPLRYPGGKRKLSTYIKSIIERNDLSSCIYVEPYAGGASVALALLFDGYAERVIINDFDISIYAFWYSILNNTEEFIRLINDTPITIIEWRKQKSIQNTKSETDLLSLGFSTFYLNRTNRSGIIKAGVIGGIEQKGDYKIDARFNKIDLINRISKIALRKNEIQLFNLDAVKLIKKISKKDADDYLIYFDPPYYIKGKELYVNHYNHKDHVNVAAQIKKMENFNWIVSYDDNIEIRKLYKEFKKFSYTLNYSTAQAKKGTEILILNNHLIVPKKNKPKLII